MARGDKSAENGKKGGRPRGAKDAKTLARESGQAKALEREALTAERIMAEMALHTFSNVQDLFDECGNLKPIHTLTRAQAASIASLEVVKKNAEAGDGQTDLVHKVRVVDKLKTLEMLARCLAMFKDRLELSGTDALFARLASGRQRNAQRGG